VLFADFIISAAGACSCPTVSVNMQFSKKSAPSQRELSNALRLTEGVKKDFIKLWKELPQSFFLRKNASPLEDGAE